MANPTRAAALKLTGLIGTLRGSQLFGGLGAEDLTIVAGFTQVLRLGKGETLFREGEPSRGCYVMQSGAVNVHRVNAMGREQVIHVFRAGESLAEASLASPTGYPANARAVEPSTVLLIPKAPILELIAGRPDLALRMLGAMSQHLRVLVGMLDDLTLKDVETRLLNWLIKHGRGAARGIIRLPSTKRVLAAELGTSSETLSRTFARLREENLLEVDGNTLRVRDAIALEARFRHLLGEG
jgi:CRP-like cAMP-binding protein